MNPPPEFIAAIGGHPIVARVLWRRGFQTIGRARAFLDPSLYKPAPPNELPDLDLAAERLRQAIHEREPIRIWGDFDVDGQTATSVLLLGLRAAGATVSYTIPNRALHNHGLNNQGVSQAHADGVRVLLTCDCAVTDFEQVAFARSLGLEVIVTDHHDLGTHLPAALAVVNPKRLPETHPLRSLPGVGVAYKLIEALLPERADLARSLLDLVALGIVADLADQIADTRYLLQLGLAQLRAHPRPGVAALLRNAGIDPAKVDAETIGFQLGPRLNAAGRLDTAHVSVDLLTTDDPVQAKELAAKIEALNIQRKTLQKTIEDEALRMLEEHPELAEGHIVVLHAPHWQPSVLGIVAATVVNHTGKPAIVLTSPPNELVRGSARSVPGVDIHGLILAQAHMLEHSGGHPMAAGLALKREHLSAFREGINRAAALLQTPAPHNLLVSAGEPVVDEGLPADEPPRQPETPFEIDAKDASIPLVDALERLAPFGRGNPRPLFATNALKLVRVEKFGTARRHGAFHLQDQGGAILRAIQWRGVSPAGLGPESGVDLVYTVRRNEFKGRVEAQVEVVELRASQRDGATTAGEAEKSARPSPISSARFDVIDLRFRADRDAEVARHTGLLNDMSTNRMGNWLDLSPRPNLIVLDAPPGLDEWRAALATAQPQTVVLATQAAPGNGDDPNGFMRSLQGMLKVAHRRGDRLEDPAVQARMAARINHRVVTICAGIAVARGDEAPSSLAALLEETRAYRHYFCTAPAEAIARVAKTSSSAQHRLPLAEGA